VVDAFEDALAGAMAELEEELRRRGRAYPGAQQALERLSRESGIVQGLLTGNIPANARVKLGAVGLGGLVDFDIGAYGSDHRVRSELVAIACARAERKLGVLVPPDRAVLIGDTPLDVAAALAGGAHAIGVATGPYSERELAEAGAKTVLPDLRDAERLVAAVLAVG
jgi:phosphoglycolate phosphatase-like HAD superfamily hydrolase